MKIRYLLALLCIVNILCIKAQIKGKVVEVSQKNDTTVVPGVTLVWDRTSIATTTDKNGDFKLNSSSETTKLIINAIGYKSDTLAITDVNKFLLLVLKNGLDLQEIEIVYYSNGTEISYLNPIKTEILTERSLMKAACCNLSESFETNPSIDVNFADAVSGTKQIQMLGLSGQYAQITK
ncbi:MAG: carboxypeptidase-like regulatory domain-containing protein, partial [Bacteroidia bacterium]